MKMRAKTKGRTTRFRENKNNIGRDQTEGQDLLHMWSGGILTEWPEEYGWQQEGREDRRELREPKNVVELRKWWSEKEIKVDTKKVWRNK